MFGIQDLQEEPRVGRPRIVCEDKVAEMIWTKIAEQILAKAAR